MNDKLATYHHPGFPIISLFINPPFLFFQLFTESILPNACLKIFSSKEIFEKLNTVMNINKI